MTSVRSAIALGLTVILVAIAVVLSRSPIAVIATNSVPLRQATSLFKKTTRCQNGGKLPAGTTAIRLSLSANIGPALSLKAYSGSRLLTQGSVRAGWGVDETVTVPVTPLTHAVGNPLICVAVGTPFETVQVNGTELASTSAGFAGVALRMEYLRPGDHSWLSLASSIAQHLGLGHAAPGTWIVFLSLALVGTLIALVAREISRELR